MGADRLDHGCNNTDTTYLLVHKKKNFVALMNDSDFTIN